MVLCQILKVINPRLSTNKKKKISWAFLLLNTQGMESPQENLLMEILASGLKMLKF